MAQKTGVVFDIKEFAVFDGPGIRTTVFMKGCPLHCQWCHNPEGLSPRPQLMVSQAGCTRCGACMQVCPSPQHCTTCGACIAACRGGFRKIAGETWTAEALAARLAKDADVYAATGGGVTFSGGEPMLQWDFVGSVIDRIPGISAAVETSGFCSDDVWRDVLRKCALVMMDWKVSDPALHRRYTGVEQDVILRHAQMLSAAETPFILRMPIIPGVNDNEAHFRTAAQLVRGAKALQRIDVLPYQRAAGAKYAMIGDAYAPDFDESAPPQMHLHVFDEMGIPYQLFR